MHMMHDVWCMWSVLMCTSSGILTHLPEGFSGQSPLFFIPWCIHSHPKAPQHLETTTLKKQEMLIGLLRRKPCSYNSFPTGPVHCPLPHRSRLRTLQRQQNTLRDIQVGKVELRPTSHAKISSRAYVFHLYIFYPVSWLVWPVEENL